MPSKFKIGQQVRFSSHIVGRPGSPGVYSVVKILPHEYGEQEYHVKSGSEPHERVARESQLEKAG